MGPPPCNQARNHDPTPTGRRTNPAPRVWSRGRKRARLDAARPGRSRGPSGPTRIARAPARARRGPRPAVRPSSRCARCSRYSTVFLCACRRSAARRALPPSASQASSVSRSRAVRLVGRGQRAERALDEARRAARGRRSAATPPRPRRSARRPRGPPARPRGARRRLGVADPEALETVRRACRSATPWPGPAALSAAATARDVRLALASPIQAQSARVARRAASVRAPRRPPRAIAAACASSPSWAPGPRRRSHRTAASTQRSRS